MNSTEFGKLLSTLRHQKNLTQLELATELGVSVSSISKWENGKNYPDISMFEEISSLFNISFNELHTPQRTLEALKQRTIDNNQAEISNMPSAR